MFNTLNSVIISTAGILKKHLAFFGLVLLAIIFSYPHQEGISPFDPGTYANCAVQLLQGVWDYENFYCNRIGSYLLVALAIKLFGFNGYYLTWVTVFELVLLLAFLYYLLQSYNKQIALITCGLVGFTPLMLWLAGTLNGDIMATLTSNLCILWLWRFRIKQPQTRGIGEGVALAVMWYFALLTKEYALYFLVPVLIIFISDKKAKHFNSFWNAAIITGVSLGLLFLSVYILKTGDLFYRLSLLENVPNQSPESYAIAGPLVMLARLTFLPVKFLIENYSYFIIFVFTMIQLVNKTENSSEKYFKIYMVSLLALWWMGTQSLKSWTPILLIDRLWLPLIVPMAINAAHVLFRILNGDTGRYATARTKILLGVTGILVIVSGYINENNLIGEQTDINDFILLRLCVPFFAFLTIFNRELVPALIEFIQVIVEFAIGIFRKHYVIIVIVLLPLVYHFRTVVIKDPRDNNYLAEKEHIDFVRKSGQEAIILSERSVYMNQGIYYGFDPKVKLLLHFIDWSTVDTTRINEFASFQPVYLLVTNDRIHWYITHKKTINTLYPKPNEPVPNFVLHPDMNWKLIRANQRATLYQYKPGNI